MKPSELKLAIHSIIRAERAPLILGAPGVGKTDIVRQVAHELGMQFDAVLLSQLDSVDLRGIPSIKNGRTVWNVPEFLPHADEVPKGKIILLDEFTACRPDVEVAAYQLVLDRKCGNWPAPPNVHFVLAGNRVKDRAQARQLGTAIRNRVTTVEVESNLDDWVQWALENEIHPAVLAFVRFQPKFLNELECAIEGKNPGKEERERLKAVLNENSFCTPRSLAFLSRLVTAGVDRTVEFDVYKGTVGVAAATQFMHFLKVQRDLPDLDLVLAQPKSTPVPARTNPGALYAIATGLPCRVTEANIDAAMIYIDRLDPRDFQVLAVRDILARNPSLGKSAALQKFILKNKDVLC